MLRRPSTFRGIHLGRVSGVRIAARQLHDDGVWGYHRQQEFKLPDFTPEELANRVRNASLLRLVESYRKHGHRAAHLDPLDLAERPNVPALDPRRYGFPVDPAFVRSDFVSQALPDPIYDSDAEYDTSGILDFPPDAPEGPKTIGEIAGRLQEVYCGGVAYEFMHIPSKHERRFLETLLESSHAAPLSKEQQLWQWDLLAKSESFDNWAAKRFPNVKRYGLEGAEGMMVALAVVLEEAGRDAMEDVVLAMPHRGRLNVLTQLLDLDMRLLVRKMRGLPTLPPSLPPSLFTDDVLSHLFLTTSYQPHSAKSPLTVHLLPNPSHLETVNGVALGFARGLQVPFGSLEAAKQGKEYSLGDKVLSIQVHGDAAFGGQGVVAESLNLASLPHFSVGGSVRIVVNNQLGYTTPATDGRTSFYATDLAKSIAAPILHVNGDRLDDVARTLRLAVAYQRKFRKEIIVDLVVYRRRGHNELDEPAFTSPVMYRKIADLPSVARIYEDSLVSTGLLSSEDAGKLKQEHRQKLDISLVSAEPENFKVPELAMPRGWDTMKWPEKGDFSTWKSEKPIDTGVEKSLLQAVAKRSVAIPDHITIHPRLSRMHIAKRLQSLESGEGVDFATAEAMAFGSLLSEGFSVRLCGQDSGRGTFSQRHAIVSDQNSARIAVPLQSLADSPLAGTEGQEAGTFEVVNSPLSEYAVLGFEQGVAWVSPKLLPIWEAQFGDFLNTAQVMADTYFGSGETKWGMQSALTLLLPHGYDSAGPEHSSARIERFLQLTNEPLSHSTVSPNFHVINVTTAAQYFHLLRRQMLREYRKPLVVFSPKGILRLPAAASSISEMTPGTSFRPVLDDPSISEPASVRKIVFLSGKMYYDLVKERSERGFDGQVAFVRIEEVSPFPYLHLKDIVGKYSCARDFVFAQEEPENAGSYQFVQPRLLSVLESHDGFVELEYCGRPAMSCPAPGVGSYFNAQKEEILGVIFRASY